MKTRLKIKLQIPAEEFESEINPAQVLLTKSNNDSDWGSTHDEGGGHGEFGNGETGTDSDSR